ncbi:MAG: tetratricopeptide repeat protein [Candidatus Sumerlaeia bacterium]|nr:tetratricopeptide repeat protein [Candidatus Sumerlaeia bacterium]
MGATADESLAHLPEDVEAAPAPVADPAAEEAAIEEAMRLLKAEDLDLQGRIEGVRTIVDRHPNRAEGWAALGELRMQAGSDEAALMAFERALQRDPTLHSAWYWTGILKKRGQRDLPGALEAFRQARAHGAPEAVQLNEIAVTLAQLGRMREAYRSWVEALAVSPDWGVLHANALKAALSLGMEDAARGHFESSLKAERFEDQAVLMWGDFLLRSGRKADARKAYELGLERSPESFRIRYYLATVLADEKRKDAALAHFRQVSREARVAGDRETAYIAEKGLFALEHPADLKKLVEAENLLVTVSDDPVKGRKSVEKAVGILTPLIEKHPQLWEARLFRGQGRRMLGESAHARLDFEAVLEAVPDQPNALMNMAMAYRDQRNYYKQVEFARKAVEAAPRDPTILANAGFVLLDADWCEEAAEMLARADAALPAGVQGDPLAPLADAIRTRCGP